MDRDRSLDEFVGGDSADSAPDADADVDRNDSAESGIDADAEATGDDDTSIDPDDIESAAVTYRWEPEGARCADCGETVEQLWSGESGPVCDECKEW